MLSGEIKKKIAKLGRSYARRELMLDKLGTITEKHLEYKEIAAEVEVYDEEVKAGVREMDDLFIKMDELKKQYEKTIPAVYVPVKKGKK